MKTFRVKIDGTFEAEDIDEALEWLATYFAERAHGENIELLLVGTVQIEPELDMPLK